MNDDIDLDELEKIVAALESLGDALTAMFENLATEFIKIGDAITAVLPDVVDGIEECDPNNGHECGNCGDHWVEP